MRIKCQKCLRRFSGKVGTLLCENCKIELYQNGRKKKQEESRSEKEIAILVTNDKKMAEEKDLPVEPETPKEPKEPEEE